MLVLKAQKRNILGKKVRVLRGRGLVPAVIYGKGKEAESLSVPFSDFLKVWRQAGEASLVELDIEGRKETVLISDVAIDALRNIPIHADFLAVRMDEAIEATVPIEFIGESPAVKSLGAVLVKVMHEIEVKALPADLPNEIQVDISRLAAIDDRITVADIARRKEVEFKAHPEDVVALVAEQKQEEEVAPEAAPSIEDIEVVGKREKEEEMAKEGEEKKEE